MTSQLTKLGLVPGKRWCLVDPPPGFAFALDDGDEEPDAAAAVSPGSPADVVLAFARSAADIPLLLRDNEQAIFPAGALWIAWPRRVVSAGGGGHASDITDAVVRKAALARSLVDTKVAAINADWSGLKLVWRVESRR